MPHLDDEQLAVLALDAEPADAATQEHLESCDRCREELEQLRRVVAGGRSDSDLRVLTTPPPQVWQGVVASLGVGGEGQHGSSPRPAGGGLAAPPFDSGTRHDTETAPPTPLERRRQPRAPSWVVGVAGALAGAAAAALVFVNLDEDQVAPPAEQVVARARLAEFGTTGTPGVAEVLSVADERVLHVRLADRTKGGGFREVWLLDAEAGRLMSLGVLNGVEGTFPLPEGLDLAEYPVVDVSREPFDGDPAHSSDSIARGDLEL